MVCDIHLKLVGIWSCKTLCEHGTCKMFVFSELCIFFYLMSSLAIKHFDEYLSVLVPLGETSYLFIWAGRVFEIFRTYDQFKSTT